MTKPSQAMITLNNGNKMPQFGLGTFFQATSDDKDKIYQACRDAISAGYRMIDTAYVYGIEDQVGQAINDAIKENQIKRDDIFVVTKLAPDQATRAGVRKSLTESLEKLGLAYVDLFLIHWPCLAKPDGKPFNPELDEGTDIHTETWAAMEDAVKDGLTRSIGVSNYNARQITDLMKVSFNFDINYYL